MSDFRNRTRASAPRHVDQAEQIDRSAKSGATPDDYRVSSTWTGQILVTDRELETIELYLGEALDQLLSLARHPKARGPPS
jgi:hypothetical protein